MTIAKHLGQIEKLYTPAEFEAMPEFEQRFELIDGRLVEKLVPGDRHGRIIQRINRRITLFDPDEKLGQVWPPDTSFDVGTGWLPMPDIGFVVAERLPPETPKSVKAVPDLVVEVHSPSDLRSQPEREAAADKIKRWQAVGVKILWEINPDDKTVSVYHPEQAGPIQVLGIENELSGEDVIPNFRLKVSELFSNI